MRLASTVAAVLMLLLAACSSQQLYSAGQEWQKNECRKIPDGAERQRCLNSSARSYEDYKAEAGKSNMK